MTETQASAQNREATYFDSNEYDFWFVPSYVITYYSIVQLRRSVHLVAPVIYRLGSQLSSVSPALNILQRLAALTIG